ncbi:hypothetical protein [Endozoicomonas sp.]|uniref:hypothetical protein n=1 Tax=Endozoicomonas sp. TaxID=1892382 RepID=UPI0028850F10|nr:hypothetical protein [Endozoicomonas sp.]
MSRVSDTDVKGQSVKESGSSALNLLPIADESYLCLLCLRDSTERIVMLYFNYIKLRQAISGDTPAALIGMLMVLQEKHNGLKEKLLQYYPENMASGKWHDRDEQNEFLGYLSEENREFLQQICITEMKMMLLISQMMEQ